MVDRTDRGCDESLVSAQIDYYRAVALSGRCWRWLPHEVRSDKDRVQFVRAEVFDREPERRYDGVLLGFWISHGPRNRFAEFWRLINRCLLPGGRVFLVDDAHRTADELGEGTASMTIQRRLKDGTPLRLVEVPHDAPTLHRELRDSGGDIAVHPTFYRGAGRRVGERPTD